MGNCTTGKSYHLWSLLKSWSFLPGSYWPFLLDSWTKKCYGWFDHTLKIHRDISRFQWHGSLLNMWSFQQSWAEMIFGLGLKLGYVSPPTSKLTEGSHWQMVILMITAMMVMMMMMTMMLLMMMMMMMIMILMMMMMRMMMMMMVIINIYCCDHDDNVGVNNFCSNNNAKLR